MFIFPIIYQQPDGTGSLNRLSWKKMTCLYHIVNTMAADGLAMQGAVIGLVIL